MEYATSYPSLNIKIIDKVLFFFLLFKEIKQKHIYMVSKYIVNDFLIVLDKSPANIIFICRQHSAE